jgi:hypothetical protein
MGCIVPPVGIQQPLIAWQRSGFGEFRQRTADELATLAVKLCSWMVCVSFQCSECDDGIVRSVAFLRQFPK